MPQMFSTRGHSCQQSFGGSIRIFQAEDFGVYEGAAKTEAAGLRNGQPLGWGKRGNWAADLQKGAEKSVAAED